MKIRMLAFCAILLVCTGCSPNLLLRSPSSEEFANEFYSAIVNNDLELVKEFATQSDLNKPLEMNINGFRMTTYPLLVAYSRRDCRSVAVYLLEQGAEVNIADESGETPLILTVSTPDMELLSLAQCSYLVERGADVNARCENGSALGIAAGLGHTTVVDYLLEHGAVATKADIEKALEIDGRDNDCMASIRSMLFSMKSKGAETGLSEIVEAAFYGDSEQISSRQESISELSPQERALLARVAAAFCDESAYECVVASVGVGSQSMYATLAAQNGNVALLESLIRKDVSSITVEALLGAVRNTQTDALQKLLNLNILLTPENIKMVYLEATKSNNVSALQLLHNNDNLPDQETVVQACQKAAQYGSYDVIEYLLEHYGDADSASKTLTELARFGVKISAERCIELGASEHSRNQALVTACRVGNNDIASLLIASGADVNHYTVSDGTPLMAAVVHGHLSTVKLLLSLSANCEVECWDSKATVLNIAASKSTSILKCLIEAGADVNHPNANGVTPLATASQNNRKENIKLLANAGAVN